MSPTDELSEMRLFEQELKKEMVIMAIEQRRERLRNELATPRGSGHRYDPASLITGASLAVILLGIVRLA